MGEHNIVKRTGCLPSCTRRLYTAEPLIQSVLEDPNIPEGTVMFQVKEKANVASISRPLIPLQFYYTSNEYTEKTEYFVYGFTSLVADFGGYLGLLMGHSLLSLYDAWKELVAKGGKSCTGNK